MLTFSERVVKIARSIPKGRVTTYGRIARAAGGGTMASQSITSILGKAWENGMKDIPFHRIVYADGRIWVDDKHRKTRMKLYKEEGIELDEKDRIKNFRDVLFELK
jgi:methylated-DNA-protein-cysteine methyltransferase-like protein